MLQCPPSATFCTNSIRCWPGAALFDPTRSHTPLYNHQPARKESHFHTGNGHESLAVGSQGHFQCDKSSPEQSQLFFALLIKSASLVKTASNRFIRIWVSLSC
eukprot:TRINITY_DN446_c0_g1_i6.p1 TRINITY_DN446_c0_g1~~TRINITY_DN446_c0_g1_i6.p1  ORF type:complete len:103 (-),score=13.63 TRINITY_DN446_c0_g1_i6:44-352(-)